MSTRFHEFVASRIVVFSVVAALGTFVVVYVLDFVLARIGLPAEATLIDDVLLGSMVGFLVALLEAHHQKELRRQREKAFVLEAMNHHVRNALQTIIYVNFKNPDSTDAEKIVSATRRIEWALREVLPGEVSPEEKRSAANAQKVIQRRECHG